MLNFRGRGTKRDLFLQSALPHLDTLYRMAIRTYGDPDLAKDLVQETYQEAWRSFANFKQGTNCRAWLLKILFRVGNRHKNKHRKLQEVDLGEVPEERFSVSPGPVDRTQNKVIIEILNSFPEAQRIVLVLADVENLAYREIAELMEIPVGTVMSRLNRARSLFREKYLGRVGNSLSA